MKLYYVAPNFGNFQTQDIEDGILIVNAQCQGTTLETTVNVASAALPNLLRAIVVATYVNSSASAIALFGTDGNNSWAETDVYAIGPNGVSITVFLGAGSKFIDGSTSMNIPTGSGKRFRTIGADGSGHQIVGILG